MSGESSEPVGSFVELDRGRHERRFFASGKPELDEFLKTRALRHAEAGTSKTLVLVDPEPESSGRHRVLAWFAVSFTTIERETLPERVAKKLPRYPVPAFLIAQLAVDRSIAGRGYGGITLYGALRYIARVHAALPAVATVVDCLDDEAASFYRHYGFEPLTRMNDRERLYLPMPTVLALDQS